MAEVEQSQPGTPEPSGSAAVAAFKRHAAELPEALAEPEEAPAAAPSPATIIIPLSRIPEKFRSKPEAIVEAYENAEHYMHAKADEAAQLRKETEQLRAKVAAYEVQRTPQPQPDPWSGINPEETIIADPRRVGDHIIAQARAAAADEARKAAKDEANTLRGEQENREKVTAIISALEGAKSLAGKAGYELSDDEWKQYAGYIAPAVGRENDTNPVAIYDPNRYFEHFKTLKGAPNKTTLPTEGTPPVAAKSASVNTGTNAPTLSREEQQLKKQISGALAHLIKETA